MAAPSRFSRGLGGITPETGSISPPPPGVSAVAAGAALCCWGRNFLRPYRAKPSKADDARQFSPNSLSDVDIEPPSYFSRTRLNRVQLIQSPRVACQGLSV